MASYTKYTAAIEPLNEQINAGSDTWKLALSNTINAADTSFVAGTTDLPTSGGYTAGGITLSTASAAQSGGTYTLTFTQPGSPAWTATGGGFTFRYCILWNSTNSIPVAYWDRGSSATLVAGDTFDPTFTTAYTST